MRVFYCRNEGPYCGCWKDGYVIATPEATAEEIDEVMKICAEELTELTYELNSDENEYDSIEEEEEWLIRDDEIAAECSCDLSDFELSNEPAKAIFEYGLFENWNKNHTVCYMIGD